MTGPEFGALRLSAGLSKMALARLLGVSRQAVQNFEAGRVKVPPARERILRALAAPNHGE